MGISEDCTDKYCVTIDSSSCVKSNLLDIFLDLSLLVMQLLQMLCSVITPESLADCDIKDLLLQMSLVYSISL